MNHDDSPWDQPWGGPRRGAAQRGGSWSGGPPPWVQGLIGLAQRGGRLGADFGRRSSAATGARRYAAATSAPRSSTCSPSSR